MVTSIYVTVAMFAFIFLSFLLYLQKRKQIRSWKIANDIKLNLKKPKSSSIPPPIRKDLKVVSHSVFVSAQLFILLVTVAVTLYFYDLIPERFLVHWNSSNEPDRIVDKTYVNVFMLPAIQLLMIPMMFFSHYSFIKSKQKISPYLSDLSSKQSKLFRQAWSYYFLIVTVLTQLLLSGIHFFSLFFADKGAQWIIGMTIPFVVIIVGYSVYLTWKYGQGGEKLFLNEAGELPVEVTETDEERFWKWGVLYYNPERSVAICRKTFRHRQHVEYGQMASLVVHRRPVGIRSADDRAFVHDGITVSIDKNRGQDICPDLFFDLFFKLFVMLGNGHINDAVSQVDVADQQRTMEIGAEGIFIAGALGFVFSIVAPYAFDFSERTHIFAKGRCVRYDFRILRRSR